MLLHIPGLSFPSSIPLPREIHVPFDGLYYDSLLGTYTTQRGARRMCRSISGRKPLINLDM